MTPGFRSVWSVGRLLRFTCSAVLLACLAAKAPAQSPAPLPAQLAPSQPVGTLTLASAVQQALIDNPQLKTVRQQHGIAAAGVVIAKQYPFNPVYHVFVLPDGGPSSAGITNRVFTENTTRVDVEIHGQAKHREAAAIAAMSRVDWDIAQQEVVVSVAAIRAFNAVLYRKRKLEVLEETIRLNKEVVEQIRRLVDAGRMRPADLILARTEVDAAQALLGQGRTTLALAWGDLRRAIGTLNEDMAVDGWLGLRSTIERNRDRDALLQAALEHRPDVRSRMAAVAEAEARWRFECANRWGNPSIGPGMEYNETSVTFVGMWLVTPLPILNTRRGEIQQRDAERVRAREELNQFQIQAQQDVLTALARLADATRWADAYENEVLPNLKRSREDLDKLFAQGEQGVDIVRIIDVQRKYLKAQDSFLDALFEVSQAGADLAAAVGDPTLAIDPAACTSIHP